MAKAHLPVIDLASIINPMNWRKLLPYLFLNAIVSAVVMLLVLYLWEVYRGPQQVALIPPTLAVATTNPPPVVDTPAAVAPTETQFILVTQLPTRTPLPQSYVVQPGDTLGSIALEFDIAVEDLMAINDITDPDLLAAGQTLIIPGEDDLLPPTELPPTAGASATPLATLTPAPSVGEAQLAIRTIRDVGLLDTEALVIVNLGGAVQLSGWQLQDSQSNTYQFPTLSLFEGGQITIHTTSGSNTVTDLYWGLSAATWESGDTAQLIDPAGNLHTTFNVP